MEKWLIMVIRGYRFLISPWFWHCCRFFPSCSHYAEESLKRFGFFKGGILMCCRLAKCHPWHKGGVDLCPTEFGKGSGRGLNFRTKIGSKWGFLFKRYR